jgi:hypothetical protein
LQLHLPACLLTLFSIVISLESILLHCYVAASKKFIWTALSATVLLPYWLISQAVRLIHRQVRISSCLNRSAQPAHSTTCQPHASSLAAPCSFNFKL